VGKEPFKMSVIICTYNRADLLKGALETLNDQYMPRGDYQIIVVDDGSTDKTEHMTKLMAKGMYERLEYYRIEHAGRAAARNKGLKEAQGDWILFVDDDILAPPDLLQEHFDYHKTRPHIVVRGPIINIKQYQIPDKHSASWRDYSSAFFCTCNASVSKFALLQVGGFDESFMEYGFEDNELGWRLREKGWNAQFNSKAIVYHYKPEQPKEHMTHMIKQAQELGRSAVAYYRKHPHWKVALATGLHPALKPWNKLLSSEFIGNLWMKSWDGRVDTMGSGMRSFLESRIFQYHYLKTLEEEFARTQAAVEEPAGPVNKHLEGARPPKGEPGTVGNKNLRANVHLQQKAPPWESS